jgi:hypothetical protein
VVERQKRSSASHLTGAIDRREKNTFQPVGLSLPGYGRKRRRYAGPGPPCAVRSSPQAPNQNACAVVLVRSVLP